MTTLTYEWLIFSFWHQISKYHVHIALNFNSSPSQFAYSVLDSEYIDSCWSFFIQLSRVLIESLRVLKRF